MTDSESDYRVLVDLWVKLSEEGKSEALSYLRALRERGKNLQHDGELQEKDQPEF